MKSANSVLLAEKVAAVKTLKDEIASLRAVVKLERENAKVARTIAKAEKLAMREAKAAARA